MGRLRHGLEDLIELRGIDHEGTGDRFQRLGRETLSRARGHDVEGLDPAIPERTSAILRRHARDIVLERLLAVKVLLARVDAPGPLARGIVAAAGKADAGPAAERMADETDALLVDEPSPLGSLQHFVESERDIARAVPQAVAAGHG